MTAHIIWLVRKERRVERGQKDFVFFLLRFNFLLFLSLALQLIFSPLLAAVAALIIIFSKAGNNAIPKEAFGKG